MSRPPITGDGFQIARIEFHTPTGSDLKRAMKYAQELAQEMATEQGAPEVVFQLGGLRYTVQGVA